MAEAGRATLVRQQRLESDGVLSLQLESPDGCDLPTWEPGAHIDVILPSGAVRQYSLCGDPADTASYRIAVLNEANGRGGSREIHEVLRVGDTVTVRGPRNHFPLEPAAHYVLIAGGIGITPLLSMARQLTKEGASWSLLYGGRSRSSMAFVDELAALGGNVTIAASDRGDALDLESALADVPSGTSVYCCGPTRLLDAVQDSCDRFLGAYALHFERFAAPTTTQLPVDSGTDTCDGPAEFEVELRRSGRTVKVPADRSLLEVALEVNPDILCSCEEGFCGSCETLVLEGVPEHHDSILTEAEREKGESMMICVGRSRTTRLVLDA
ncbi:PDR/VanB family oxidoreductase [Rhodococcus xishaensis]|uniref:Oxidoreductase n=1 Tax=Rhodococcus xishaensis TaxID=2487364 RepID=A0A3S3B321_9NOCA|nr:PDR/VanB family oxidoreductase [Rhodococcus xishaensis]RVW01970.1 oxidoreductase [Rhodococcus xishaensis]